MLRKHTAFRKAEASFTIEAAVVVPLAMILMVTMIYVAFYIHNAATIAAVTDAAVLERAVDAKENRNAVCQGVQELLAVRLIGETAVSVSATGDGNKGSACATAAFSIPLSVIDELTGGRMGSLSFQTEISNLNGRQKLLLYKSICDGVSDLLTGY